MDTAIIASSLSGLHQIVCPQKVGHRHQVTQQIIDPLFTALSRIMRGCLLVRLHVRALTI